MLWKYLISHYNLNKKYLIEIFIFIFAISITLNN